jgi:putative IMPACT (imprinted ancient) family translation regulator
MGRTPAALRQAGITTNCDVLVGYFGGTELKIRRAKDGYRPAPAPESYRQ